MGLWRLRLGGVMVACGDFVRGWRFVRRRGWPLILVSTQYSLSIYPLQSLSLSLWLFVSLNFLSVSVSVSLSLSLSLTPFFLKSFLSESVSKVKSVNGFKKNLGWAWGCQLGSNHFLSVFDSLSLSTFSLSLSLCLSHFLNFFFFIWIGF